MDNKTKNSTHGSLKQTLKRAKEAAVKNNMLESSLEVLRLRDEHNIPAREIVTKLNKIGCKISLQHVYNYFKLAEAPTKVHAHIRANRIQESQVLGCFHKHQTTAELIEEVDKVVAKNELNASLTKQKKDKKKKQTLKNKVINFLETNGIIPTSDDKKSILQITSKYAV